MGRRREVGRGVGGGAGLHACASSGAGGDEVAWLPAVGAHARVRPPAAFLEGEWAAGAPGSIQIHGDWLGGVGGMLVGGGML